MNKKDRKAWLRIIEAFLAILIIMGALLIIMAREKTNIDISEEVYEKQRQILNIISKNDNLRTDVISGNNINVDNTIRQIVPETWNFTTKICGLNDICNTNTPYEKEVYATEIIITSTLTEYNPKKLKFFVWLK